jgi:hypothetical protein
MPVCLLAIALFFTAGCKCYNHQWKKAAAGVSSEDPFEGRWEGSWRSDHNGHSGRLRCIVSRKWDDSYEANFQAKYRKVLTFHYPVTLLTTRGGTNIAFLGEANLGWWAGGLYSYAGHADATNFFSTYSNRFDYGTFNLRKQ